MMTTRGPCSVGAYAFVGVVAVAPPAALAVVASYFEIQKPSFFGWIG